MAKDLNFEVAVIAISLKGNKIAKAGDKVAASQLAGDVNVLLKEGYIKHTSASKKAFEAAEKAAKKETELKKSLSKKLEDKTVDELKYHVEHFGLELKVDVDQVSKSDLLAAIKDADKKSK